jgi:hypothetical protein
LKTPHLEAKRKLYSSKMLQIFQLIKDFAEKRYITGVYNTLIKVISH